MEQNRLDSYFAGAVVLADTVSAASAAVDSIFAAGAAAVVTVAVADTVAAEPAVQDMPELE